MNARQSRMVAIAGLISLLLAGPACAADPAWQAKVVKLVTANYSYPRSAELRREQGRAIVKVVISATGKPVSVQLIQSSGSEILDREALRIPMKVGTFPATPTGADIAIVVPINWQIG